MEEAGAMEVAVHWATLAATGLELQHALDAVELARLRRFERPADRGRSLLGAALLRTAVGERLGIAPAAVAVDRTCEECGSQHGAPRLLHQHAPWVSVSHSGLLVVVAIADAPLGVDVQRLADLPTAEDGSAWVGAEAIAKAKGVASATGAALGPTSARSLPAPLPGYAAALALPTSTSAPLLRVHGP